MPRLNGDLPPSHPSFDRGKISKDEFIELLLFEIKELQSAMKSKDEKITLLILKLETLNSLVSREAVDGKSIEIQKAPDEEVPQRSARRKLAQKVQEEPKSSVSSSRRESLASITSNGPIDISEGVPLSSNFRIELSAALGISDSPVDPPLISLNNHIDGTASSSTSCFSLSGSGVGESLSLGPETDIQISKPEENGRRTEIGEFPGKIEPENSSMRKGSNPSLNSYRSRIKLPSTLKQKDPKSISPEEGLNSHDTYYLITSSTVKSSDGDLGEPGKSYDPKLPHTPDGFTQDKGIFTRSETSGNYSEDSQSFFGSSFTSSPPNSSVTPTTNSHFEILKTPNLETYASSTDSFHGLHRSLSQTPVSNFHVLSTPKAEDEDVDLFIKPEEFQTIRIKVVSTITINTKKSEDPNCTLSINDTETGKEMWRIRKTYSQLLSFDTEIRPVVEIFGLPSLPEKSSFNSTTPLKVDARRIALQDYFNTIFVMPHLPRLVLFRICRFLSLNFVNPLNDFRTGAKKEGFLIRRYKGLGTAWKVRWCQVDGPELEIYDSPGGGLLEQVRLAGSQIGRQSSDSVAEERGYRHAFLILENTKSSKLSSSLPKHFFCAESDRERDEWVAAMVEFTENDPISNQDDQYISQEQDAPHGRANDLHSELYASGRELSGVSFKYGQPPQESVTSITTNMDDTMKDNKKAKKRSRFAFRNRASIHTENNSIPQDMQTLSSSPSTESLMQVYLDQMKLSEEPARIVFGRDIEDAFNISNHLYNGHRIPSICFRCLDFLSKTGAVYEEGIFRLSGSASSIRQLKDKFNCLHDLDLFESQLRPDMHTVAGLLKTYLRELPNPIFGRRAYSELQNLVTQTGGKTNSSTILKMRDFLRDPGNVNEIHFDLCVSIFGFLYSVIDKSSTNKMSLKNVCIVFVPTLNISIDVLSACLTDFDCIFGNAEPTADETRQVLDLQIPTF